MESFATLSRARDDQLQQQQQTLPLQPTHDDTRFLENFLSTAFTSSVGGHDRPTGGSFSLGHASPIPAHAASGRQGFGAASTFLFRRPHEESRDNWHPSYHDHEHEPEHDQLQSVYRPQMRGHAHVAAHADDDGRSSASVSSALERALERPSSAGSGSTAQGWEREPSDVFLRAGGRDDDEDKGRVSQRAGRKESAIEGGVVKTGQRGHLTGMAKMRNDKLREAFVAAEPERRRAAEIAAGREERKAQAGMVKSLLSQLRDTQALFAASVLHAGIASSSLSASQTQASSLQAELKRLKRALKDAERVGEDKAREVEHVKGREKEARERLARYAEELKVRDALAVGRREGREEAFEEISRWAPPATSAPPAAPALAVDAQSTAPAGSAPAAVLPVPGPLRPPPVPDESLPAIAPSSVALPSGAPNVVLKIPPVVPPPSTNIAAVAPAVARSSEPTPMADPVTEASILPAPSADDIKHAQLKALIAEVLKGVADAGAQNGKAAYTRINIAAPPVVREPSVRREPERTTSTPPPAAPTSPRSKPPDYRPSARTPPTRHVDPLPAHFRSYSTATSAGNAAREKVPVDQVSFDDAIFRPALAQHGSSGRLAPSRAPSQLSSGAHHQSSFKHPTRSSPRPASVQPRRPSSTASVTRAGPQGAFKHMPPSFDIKSPIPPAARPRPARGDTFAAVPGHQEARDSKYPPFTVPGFSESAHDVERQPWKEEDVYPRMRHYNNELEWFEGAERNLGTLPPSDGSSAAKSITLSPTPMSPPRLSSARPTIRPPEIAPASPLSTYGDARRPASNVARGRSGQHGRSRSLGPSITAASMGSGPPRIGPLNMTLPQPLGLTIPMSAGRPQSLYPAPGPKEKPPGAGRNTFHGQSGWPGTSPTARMGDPPPLSMGRAEFPRRMDRLSMAPSLVIQPPTQSSKNPSRKTASSDARPAPPAKSPILPQTIPLPVSRTPTRGSSWAESQQVATMHQSPLQPSSSTPTQIRPLNVRPQAPGSVDHTSSVLPIPPTSASSVLAPAPSPRLRREGAPSSSVIAPPSLSALPVGPSSSPSAPVLPSIMRPSLLPSTLRGLSSLDRPPLPPKDRPLPQPLQQQRPRSPASSSIGTGWQSARASTVNSADSAWLGEHTQPSGGVDPAAIHLPLSRTPSRARTPSLMESIGPGTRSRSRPPTNYGGTVASTIEEVEEDGTDRSRRRSQQPKNE